MSFAGGGLPGGSWTLAPHGYELHGMRDVPGVALSGSIRIRGETTMSQLQITGHLTVRGRLSGALTLRGLTLSGRVGGALVRARLLAL
jgi:hypothetical protein